MANDKTFNGWTNYETWRVNLEVFDAAGDYYTPEAARDLVEELIEGTTSAGLGRDYALAFLSDVNWHEISKHTKQFEDEDESEDEA